jgi:hypothetical protein
MRAFADAALKLFEECLSQKLEAFKPGDAS